MTEKEKQGLRVTIREGILDAYIRIMARLIVGAIGWVLVMAWVAA